MAASEPNFLAHISCVGKKEEAQLRIALFLASEPLSIRYARVDRRTRVAQSVVACLTVHSAANRRKLILPRCDNCRALERKSSALVGIRISSR